MPLSYPPDPPTTMPQTPSMPQQNTRRHLQSFKLDITDIPPKANYWSCCNPRRWDWSHEATRWVQSISDAWEEFRQFHGKNLSTLTPTKQQSLPGLLILVVDPNKRSFSTVTAGARSKHIYIYYIYSYVHVYQSIILSQLWFMVPQLFTLYLGISWYESGQIRSNSWTTFIGLVLWHDSQSMTSELMVGRFGGKKKSPPVVWLYVAQDPSKRLMAGNMPMKAAVSLLPAVPLMLSWKAGMAMAYMPKPTESVLWNWECHIETLWIQGSYWQRTCFHCSYSFSCLTSYSRCFAGWAWTIKESTVGKGSQNQTTHRHTQHGT